MLFTTITEGEGQDSGVDLGEPDVIEAIDENESFIFIIMTGQVEEHDHPRESDRNSADANVFRYEPLSAEERSRLASNRAHVYPDNLSDESSYDPDSLKLLDLQTSFYEWLSSVKTKVSYKYKGTGERKKAHATPMSVPLVTESDTTVKKILVIGRYMPDNLRNSFEAREGGKVYENNGGVDRHPAEAMHSNDDMLIAKSLELVRSGMGTLFWMKHVIFMETSPISYPYGGSLGDVFGSKELKEVKKRYAKVMKETIEYVIAQKGRIKIFCISTGVRTELADMLGGEDELNSIIQDHPDVFVNLAENDEIYKTTTHPETMTNTKFISPATFWSRCKAWSNAMTQMLQHLTGNDTVVSDMGEQLYYEEEDSPAYKAKIAALEALYERNRQRWKEGTTGLQNWILKKCKKLGLNADVFSAPSVYMKHLWMKGTNPLQQHALKKCKKLGLEATAKDAMSVLQTYLWDMGENALQKDALKKCNDLGLKATAKDAMSVLQKHLWDFGKNALQKDALKKCNDLGLKATAKDVMSVLQTYLWDMGKNALQKDALKKLLQDYSEVKDLNGDVPTAWNAVSLLTQAKAFYKHLPNIKNHTGKDNCWVSIDAKDVFWIEHKDDAGIYNYITNVLSRLDGRDWRSNNDTVKKMNVGGGMWKKARDSWSNKKVEELNKDREAAENEGIELARLASVQEQPGNISELLANMLAARK